MGSSGRKLVNDSGDILYCLWLVHEKVAVNCTKGLWPENNFTSPRFDQHHF